MYHMSVSKNMTIDKEGNTKLESVDVQVNGYRNQEILERAIRGYNRNDKIPEPHEPKDWIEETWNYLFNGITKYIPFKHRPKKKNKAKRKRF